MRVALLAVGGGFGGVQRYSSELYKNMLHNRRGVKIIKPVFNPIPLLGPGLSLPIQTLAMDFGGYDIVHNTTSYPLGLIRKGGAVLITTAHEFQSLLYPSLERVQNQNLKDTLWSELVSKGGIKSALKSDYLLANSTQTKEEAVKLGFQRSRIFVTPLGLDERFTRTKIGRNHDGKSLKVGYLGAITPRKNIAMLVKAFEMVSGKNVLEIWGRPLYVDSKTAGIISQDRRIRLQGPAKESSIVKIYDSFDVFVYPSRYEGFGIPILEAQSRGLPVVIYKRSHIPEEIRKYCFEAKDADHMAQIITKIKDNGYDYKKMKKALAYARTFTWQRTAKETLAVYLKVRNG